MSKTKEEIQATYLAQHDALGTRKDAADTALFDQQHSQIWANCKTDLKARKAELETKTTLTPDEQVELAMLAFMFPAPVPSISFEKHSSGLPDRIARLESFLKMLYP